MLTESQKDGMAEWRNDGHAENSIPRKTSFCEGYNNNTLTMYGETFNSHHTAHWQQLLF